MQPWERYGIRREEYERCLQAVEELRSLWPEAPAPSAEELARDWAAARAGHLRLAAGALWKALGFEPVPLARGVDPFAEGAGRPSRG